jgi:PHD/YefM family antitoxin component YafN of YafNO toxin-antitoxin module
VKTIRADDVRIPRGAREAVANHEEVVVLNRDRPTMVILNPDDHSRASEAPRRGRPLSEALAHLLAAPLPDEAFGRDMEAVIAAVGATPVDPWEPS